MTRWLGVDLDGTLAEYHGWEGPQQIGKPVPKMLARVQAVVELGEIEVRVFTARATNPANIPYIEEWLAANGLKGLKITNVKDFGMVELWDDRVRQVESNTGEIYGNSEFDPL